MHGAPRAGWTRLAATAPAGATQLTLEREEFGRKHAEAAGPLRDWASIMRRKTYTEHLQVQQDFATVDFIGPRRAVFNICGNAYRLVVDLRYDLRRVYVRHVVTHAEYDRLMKRGLL
ncbi:MAG: type II toxin-antitoxin system HigB family toxin [Gemmatimonadaceae bacterium]